MTLVTKMFVPGIPKPQGSKSMARNGHMYEANKGLKPWRDKVQQVAALHHKGHPLDEPVMVRAVFLMPEPQRPTWDYPAGPPDTDKLQRAIGDALEKAGVLRNDSRIVRWDASKRYPAAHRGEQAGLLLEVHRMEAA